MKIRNTLAGLAILGSTAVLAPSPAQATWYVAGKEHDCVLLEDQRRPGIHTPEEFIFAMGKIGVQVIDETAHFTAKFPMIDPDTVRVLTVRPAEVQHFFFMTSSLATCRAFQNTGPK